MKKTVTVLMILMLVSFICGVEAEKADPVDRIRNAKQVQWASRNYAVADGCMIRMSDGKTVFDVVNIVSTGEYAWIETPDGILIMDRSGDIHPLEIDSEGLDLSVAYGTCGIFCGVSDEQNYIYNPVDNRFVVLPGCRIYDVYKDHEGQVYVLTEDCGIYNADGTQILEGGNFSIALNCNCDAITNEYLTAYDQTNSAVILSPFTGEIIKDFPGLDWVNYDDNHMIFRNNTALIGPNNESCGTKVIGLDGSILKELPEGYMFADAGERGSLFGIGSLWDDGCYNVLTDRTYWFKGEYSDPVQYLTCEETGETYQGTKDEDGMISVYHSQRTGKTYTFDEITNGGDIIPERYEKYCPVDQRVCWLEYVETDADGTTAQDSAYLQNRRIAIIRPDGTLLGNRYWMAIADGWDRGRTEDIGGYKIFDGLPVCALVDENGLCAVISEQGETFLPAEYEQVECVGSFSDDPKGDGFCLAAKKNGLWYVFDEKGEPLYCEPET